MWQTVKEGDGTESRIWVDDAPAPPAPATQAPAPVEEPRSSNLAASIEQARLAREAVDRAAREAQARQRQEDAEREKRLAAELAERRRQDAEREAAAKAAADRQAAADREAKARAAAVAAKSKADADEKAAEVERQRQAAITEAARNRAAAEARTLAGLRADRDARIAKAAAAAAAAKKAKEDQDRADRETAAKAAADRARAAEQQRKDALAKEETRKAAEESERIRLDIERRQAAEREAEQERATRAEQDRQNVIEARRKTDAEAAEKARFDREESERIEQARKARDARLAEERERENVRLENEARVEREAAAERKRQADADRLETERVEREARETEARQVEARAVAEKKAADDAAAIEVRAKADEESRRKATENAEQARIADAAETARMAREALQPISEEEKASLQRERDEEARKAALKRTESGVAGVIEERAVAEAEKGGVSTVAEVETETARQRAAAEQAQRRSDEESAAHAATVEDFNKRQTTAITDLDQEAGNLYGVWEGKGRRTDSGEIVYDPNGETIRSSAPFAGATLVQKGALQDIERQNDLLKAKAARGEEVSDADVATVNKLIDDYNQRSAAFGQKADKVSKDFGAEAATINARADTIAERNAVRMQSAITDAARLNVDVDRVNFRSQRAYERAVAKADAAAEQAQTVFAAELAMAGVERRDAEAIAEQEYQAAVVAAVREQAQENIRAAKTMGEGEAEIQGNRVIAPSGVEVAELTPIGISLQSSGRTDLIADEAIYQDSIRRYADEIWDYARDTDRVGKPIVVDADPRVLADVRRSNPDLKVMTPDEYKALPPQVQTAQPTEMVKATSGFSLPTFNPLFGLFPAAFALAERGNKASEKLDIIPGKGELKPFAELNNYGAQVIAENKAIAERLSAKDDTASKTLGAVINANATVVDFIRPRGAVDVALIVGPAAAGKIGRLGKAAEGATSVETVLVDSAEEAGQALKALAKHEGGGVGGLVTRHLEIEAGTARTGEGLADLRKFLDDVPAVEHPKGFVPELRPTRARAITQIDTTAAASREDLAAARRVADELTARGMEPGTLKVTVREAMKPAEVRALAQDIKASGFKRIEIVQEPAADAVLTKWRVLQEAGANVPPLEQFRTETRFVNRTTKVNVADDPIESLWERYDAKGSYVDPTERFVGEEIEVRISSGKAIEKAESATVREPKPAQYTEVVGESAFNQVRAAENAEKAFNKSARALERGSRSSGKSGTGPKTEVTTSRSLRGDVPDKAARSEIRIRFAQKRRGGLGVPEGEYKPKPPELKAGQNGASELPSGNGVEAPPSSGTKAERFREYIAAEKAKQPDLVKASKEKYLEDLGIEDLQAPKTTPVKGPGRGMTAVEEAQAQVKPRVRQTTLTATEREKLAAIKRDATAREVGALATTGGKLAERTAAKPAKPAPERVRGRPEPGRRAVTGEPVRAVGKPLPAADVAPRRGTAPRPGQTPSAPGKAPSTPSRPGQAPATPRTIPIRPSRPGPTRPDTAPITRPETPTIPGRAPEKAPGRAPGRAPVEVPAPVRPEAPAPGKAPGTHIETPTAPGPKTTPVTGTGTGTETGIGTGTEIGTGTITDIDIKTVPEIGTEPATATETKITTEAPVRVGLVTGRGGQQREPERNRPKHLRRGATTVKYSTPDGKPYPASVAMRQGIAENERDLQTGKQKFGADLYAEIPNDPTVSPPATIIIPRFTDKRPKVTTFDAGKFDVRIEPERKRIVYRRKVKLT
jgi:hypothetical protein